MAHFWEMLHIDNRKNRGYNEQASTQNKMHFPEEPASRQELRAGSFLF